MNFFKKFNKLKNDYKDNKISVVSLLVGVIGVLALTFGTSYAYLSYSAVANETNAISAGTLVLDFAEESDAIYMTNAVPQLDDDAIENNPEYTFSIKNTGTLNAYYEIRLKNGCVEGKKVNDLTPEVCVPFEHIKVAVKKGDGEYKLGELNDDGRIYLDSDTIDKDATSVQYSIKVWLDKDTPDAYQGELNGVQRVVLFVGELELYGEQITSEIGEVDYPTTLSSVILGENNVNVVTSGDGLYMSTATNDGSPTYYYSGNVENNYVKYAGETWRVVRINEDGTIRIIMEDGIDNNKAYQFSTATTNAFANSYYSGSNAESVLNSWYDENISVKDKTVVATGSYCEQMKAYYSGTYAAAYPSGTTYINSYTANYNCSSDYIIDAKVGMISLDEVMMSGGSYNTANSYYLNNGQDFWTMSSLGYNHYVYIPWAVASTGAIKEHYLPSAGTGGYSSYVSTLRPVLNLKSDTIIVGAGTSEKPWRVVIGKSETLASKILGKNNSNVVTTGDGLYMSTETNDGSPTYYYRGNVENNYVDFAGQTWRVVRINEDGTIKMILDDKLSSTAYFNENNYNSYEYMYYSNSDVDGGIKKTVDDWYTSTLETNYDSYIATTNFCETAKVKYNSSFTSGNATMEVPANYTADFKCAKDGNNKQYVSAKAGLITADEVVMAGIPLYTSSATWNPNTYLQKSSSWWTMSPSGFNDSYARVWYVHSNGVVYDDRVSNFSSVRPVISLNADTLVLGSGSSGDKWIVQ